METIERTRLEDEQRILKAVQEEIAMTYQDRRNLSPREVAVDYPACLSARHTIRV